MAKGRIALKGGTEEGKRICVFYRKGKCLHRNAPNCKSGEHPSSLDVSGTECKIKGCDGLGRGGCPYLHVS